MAIMGDKVGGTVSGLRRREACRSRRVEQWPIGRRRRSGRATLHGFHNQFMYRFYWLLILSTMTFFSLSILNVV